MSALGGGGRCYYSTDGLPRQSNIVCGELVQDAGLFKGENKKGG